MNINTRPETNSPDNWRQQNELYEARQRNIFGIPLACVLWYILADILVQAFDLGTIYFATYECQSGEAISDNIKHSVLVKRIQVYICQEHLQLNANKRGGYGAVRTGICQIVQAGRRCDAESAPIDVDAINKTWHNRDTYGKHRMHGWSQWERIRISTHVEGTW